MLNPLRSGVARAAHAAILLLGPAQAATDPVPDPALAAAAKREGLVVFYSTFSHPMKTLRADLVTMAARIATEQRAGHNDADVTTEPGFQTNGCRR